MFVRTSIQCDESTHSLAGWNEWGRRSGGSPRLQAMGLRHRPNDGLLALVRPALKRILIYEPYSPHINVGASTLESKPLRQRKALRGNRMSDWHPVPRDHRPGPPRDLSFRARGCSRFPLQILVEPRNCSLQRVDLVFAFGEAVTFSRIVVGVHRASFFLQNLYYLLGFFLRHANIVLALQHQQRRFLIADVLDRRRRFEIRRGLFLDRPSAFSRTAATWDLRVATWCTSR